jgi:hypothetical protein
MTSRAIAAHRHASEAARLTRGRLVKPALH